MVSWIIRSWAQQNTEELINDPIRQQEQQEEKLTYIIISPSQTAIYKLYGRSPGAFVVVLVVDW